MSRHPMLLSWRNVPAIIVVVVGLLSVNATFRLMVAASSSSSPAGSVNPAASSTAASITAEAKQSDFFALVPATITSLGDVTGNSWLNQSGAEVLECLPHEFACDGEKCIDGYKLCDTHFDCKNGQDEEPERCLSHTCPISHFKCNDGYCIPIGNICDYTADCPDGSDEFQCNYRKCWVGEWRCKNEQCVNEAFLCDGQFDCKDESDESFCTAEDFLTCGDGKRVHNTSKCNGIAECSDQADETDCGLCGTQQFQCHNGRCISEAHVCDSECDCHSSCEDEERCGEYYDGLPGMGYCRTGLTVRCDKSRRCIRSRFICDGKDDCLDGGTDEYQCAYKKLPRRPGISCADGRTFPYHTVCDYRRQCMSGDDELDCPYTACRSDQFRCQSGECIAKAALCNGQEDCLDRSDEVNCLNVTCPHGTFQCIHSGQCIPLTKVCDYRPDCPVDASDEPGDCEYKQNACSADQFRCASGQCIDSRYVCQVSRDSALYGCYDASHLKNCSLARCDGETWLKCRNGPCYHKSLRCNGLPDCYIGSKTWTDEEDCPFQCTGEKKCICADVTMDCSNGGLKSLPNYVEQFITKFLLSGNRLNSTMGNTTFNDLQRLNVLDLSRNNIRHLANGKLFKNLWQLKVLKLAENHINSIPENAFYGLANLRVLDLAGNNINNLSELSFNGLSSLPQLDLSDQSISLIPARAFLGLRSLLSLNLSGNPLRTLEVDALSGLSGLISLDISHTGLLWGQQKYPTDALAPLTALTTLYTSDARFCCSLGAHLANCYPKLDHFSSCADLMSNLVLRCAIWIMGMVALIANAVVIYWRMPDLMRSRIHAFLIINLAVGDIVMGVYLLIIAGADLHYRGTYVAHLHEWKASVWCDAAGFFSTVSSELSILTLLVITLDRLLTILLPFHIAFRLTYTSARFMMASIWVFVLLIAMVPFLPLPYFDNFYGRSGVCLALHITPHRFPGWEYSVFIFLALNMLACILIILSYCIMYAVALRTGKAVHPSPQKNRKEARLARRMIVIILTNLGCYLPISIMSLLALSEVFIPEEVYAWVAVFMLPVNAALNPLLYTISTRPFRRHMTSSITNRAQHLRDSLLASMTSSSRRRTSSSAHSTQLYLPKAERIFKRDAQEPLPEEL
ncbi:G-protein coupled receptor GRL101 [Hypsibius exemplaris]|uniref:G-protein coupled receptor GRL101 n=1 Tax=Hypsibius exemplaris TaxID=2072580 RepID=A0A9X6RJK0_HYPEX|nr:G-protein coupled receptor GRL101 [Hypsibius exemplaris]